MSTISYPKGPYLTSMLSDPISTDHISMISDLIGPYQIQYYNLDPIGSNPILVISGRIGSEPILMISFLIRLGPISKYHA